MSFSLSVMYKQKNMRLFFFSLPHKVNRLEVKINHLALTFHKVKTRVAGSIKASSANDRFMRKEQFPHV